MNLSSFLLAALLTAASIYTANSWAAGSGGSGGLSSTPTPARALSPEEQSDKAFKWGVRYRDKALKQEAKAAKTSKEKTRERALAKAQKHYAKAIEKQGEALRLNPRNYEAANELGYALRKTGDYRKAIGAYNYALEINPNFHPAVEYRAEAFLNLGLLSETQEAYMRLFRNDRGLADQLMDTIDRWRAAKTGQMSESETAFADWVEERKRIAKMSDALSMAPGAKRPAWSGS